MSTRKKKPGKQQEVSRDSKQSSSSKQTSGKKKKNPSSSKNEEEEDDVDLLARALDEMGCEQVTAMVSPFAAAAESISHPTPTTEESNPGPLSALEMTSAGSQNNKLSTLFLRDDDRAVEARRLKGHLPIARREIRPRLYHHLPFPVRPPWTANTTPSQLDASETRAFEEWLAGVYAHGSVERISPFEHNLEVWRQLWRVIEKSNVIVLCADVRDPLLHIPMSFHEHVTARNIPVVLVLTKCDLVSAASAAKWKRFLEQALGDGTVVVLNSGKCQHTDGLGGYASRRKTLHGKATKAQIAELRSAAKRVLDTAIAAANMPSGVIPQIGVVGQPNTGKSSLVNSILGRHAVSVSRSCGHTKHWQTQLVRDDAETHVATILDSPGLIFPTAAIDEDNEEDGMPRAWYEAAGLYPIAQIRESFSCVRFVAERVDLPRAYNLKLDLEDYGEEWTPFAICGTLADKRGYTLQRGGGAPDVHRSGLEIIYDVVDGVILLEFPPPSLEAWRAARESPRSGRAL